MMDLFNDTICAISTAPGVGGIAIIRVSGKQALNIAQKVWRGKPLTDTPSHTAHFGEIFNPADGSVLDEGLATVFRTPHSFTGEDVVEFSVHGSRYVQQQLVRILLDQGCRLAEPGEFTRRAFAAGKMDLAEAEAVADLIAATSANAHRLAVSQMRGELSKCLAGLRESLTDLAALLELELDFSEEEVEFASRSQLMEKARAVEEILVKLEKSYSIGNSMKRGIPIVIAGAPNVGKSTLLNALLETDRAIVSDIPGTTRDTIEDTLEIDGMAFRIADTAGIRATEDPIESLGIDRARRLAGEAAILLQLTDASQPVGTDIPTAPDTAVIRVITKIDRQDADLDSSRKLSGNEDAIEISALTGKGIDTLRNKIVTIGAELTPAAHEVMLTDTRHHQSVTMAIDDMHRVIDGLTTGLSGDFVAQDLRSALHHLGEITGQITTPDLLATIFSRFCIGK
ncbi:MAG: tRNA uridine-5-carboxymethylaminomethyl(34) synthesis GTPase MnmE [Paramuribaculum sp.]|nr:tRNA uridine-5-carboxymethylaminomethyl(34) synthesis GTPase MnmE [Paramuribaculum sp.]